MSRGLHTAGALARRMGVSDSLISRIETGATAVTNERAEQIAQALEMDIITVRRNLGLWVPDDEAADDESAASPVMAELTERLAQDPDLARAVLEIFRRAGRGPTPGTPGEKDIPGGEQAG